MLETTRTLLGAGLIAGCLALAACPTSEPADDATDLTDSSAAAPATETGDGATDDGRRVLVPPYLTISGGVLPEEVVLRPGQMVWAYYELPEPLPENAWLGWVPAAVDAEDAIANRDAALDVVPVGGDTKGMEGFIQSKPGEFVYRIFSGEGEDAELLLQSESWTIKAPAE